MEGRDDSLVPQADQGQAAAEPREPDAPAAGQPGAVERERDEYRDLLLRKTAEFDNYRKRNERERREFVQSAASDVLEGLLPILDDFERALRAPADASASAYRQGVELIYKQLIDYLGKRGVTPIEAVGADFDPHVHEAVTYEERPGHRDGEVVEEVRRGYKLGDRLLRPAMVRVAKA
jgi:molecular chaperone GrpE